MSTVAQREDLYSEKTIFRFASRFDTPLLLDLIFLLTYADLKGVGDETWNPRVARLLHTLYHEAHHILHHRDILDDTARRLKRIDALKRLDAFRALPPARQKRILAIPSDAFFIRHTPRQILAIAQAAFATDDLACTLENANFLTITIIRRGSIDIGYLLDKLSRLSVVQMEIIKLFDDLKYFRIDFDTRVDEDELPRVRTLIREAYAPHPPPELARPHFKQEEITIDCDHTREYATLRLRTQDQKGLLAYLIARFDHHGIDIAGAKVHTIKGRVNDLFLIEKNGNFCHNIDQLISELVE
jgi:[protein-PII] uridylyltransferase